jgi:A/G-specific adenine glycosylase
MVSELMLQQTQVARVIPKFQAFIEQFPNSRALAAAELGAVLRAWQGLGYNRRARFLWQAAQIVDNLKHFPNTPESLVKLPGVGVNTAGAILAYSDNFPAAFVETNIRTVYIHHFFADRTDVSDKEIVMLVHQTLDREHPREFYWALMDYGSHLKATVGNANKASKHYAKQSAFHGSRRQVRGRIIRLLGDHSYGAPELLQALQDERSEAILAELVREGMVQHSGQSYHL